MSHEDVVKEADRLFKLADQDGNGEIDYSEWQVATINKYGILQEEKLRNAFKMFDKVLIYVITGFIRMAVELYQHPK
jgi:calcium-dependent protein kinase